MVLRNRGDTVRIGPSFTDSVEYTVSTNPALPFDATRLPLHINYTDDTMNGILAWQKPVTTTLPLSASAEKLRAALQNLHSVGQINVVREQTGQVQLSVTNFNAATVDAGAQIVTVTHVDTTLPKIKAGDIVKFTSASNSAYNEPSGWTIQTVIGTTGFTFDVLEHGGTAVTASSTADNPTGFTNQYTDLTWKVSWISGEGERHLLSPNENMITSATTVSVHRSILSIKPSNYQIFHVTPPLSSYVIEGLTTGQPYHVIVSGANDRGVGPHSTSVPALLVPMGAPDAPYL